MKRKIYTKLLEWKNDSKGSTALLVEGARRIGKSYIVNEFGAKGIMTVLDRANLKVFCEPGMEGIRDTLRQYAILENTVAPLQEKERERLCYKLRLLALHNCEHGKT